MFITYFLTKAVFVNRTCSLHLSSQVMLCLYRQNMFITSFLATMLCHCQQNMFITSFLATMQCLCQHNMFMTSFLATMQCLCQQNMFIASFLATMQCLCQQNMFIASFRCMASNLLSQSRGFLIQVEQRKLQYALHFISRNSWLEDLWRKIKFKNLWVQFLVEG